MAIPKINRKELWKTYGITFGILLSFFLIIFLFMHFSKKSWNNGLQKVVTEVLEEKQSGKWIVEEPLLLESMFATSAAIFSVRDKESTEAYYAVIIRIPTLYGHIPAVYIYNKTRGVKFLGCAAVKGRIKNLIEENHTDSSITYWTERIPSIVEKTKKIGEGTK